MATTVNRQARPTWTAVAGPGMVNISSITSDIMWAVGSAAPTIEYGHPMGQRQNVPMELAAGETLYVKGSGIFVMTATAPL